MKRLFSKPAHLAFAVCLFIIPVFIQLLFYKCSTGDFFVYTYKDEHFNFTKPEMINFLFSYKKGLFIYTPLTFLALFGLFPLWKENRFRATWMLFTLLFIVYVLSCWWMWYYGGSFGMRPVIEFYGLFALLFYFLVDALKSQWMKWSIALFTLLIITLCQVQTLQYRYEIIHWADMTQQTYWDVFLDTHKK